MSASVVLRIDDLTVNSVSQADSKYGLRSPRTRSLREWLP